MIAAGLEVPKVLARFRIDGKDIAVALGHEDDSAAGREQPVGVRASINRKRPHRLSGFRIECLHAGIRKWFVRSPRRRGAGGASTPEVLAPSLYALWSADILLAAFGKSEIKPPGDRAI